MLSRLVAAQWSSTATPPTKHSVTKHKPHPPKRGTLREARYGDDDPTPRGRNAAPATARGGASSTPARTQTSTSGNRRCGTASKVAPKRNAGRVRSTTDGSVERLRNHAASEPSAPSVAPAGSA